MKKIMFLLLCFMLIGIQSSIANETELDGLTMEQALSLAYENNYDIKKAILQQEKTQIQDKQLDKVRDLDDNLLRDLEAKRQKYVIAKQAELGVDIANLSVEFAKLDISYQVKSAYYNVILKKEELQKVKMLKEQMIKQVDAAHKKFETGLISRIELDQIKNQLNKINMQFEQASTALEQSQLELNLVLGQSLDNEIVINQILDEPTRLESLSIDDLYNKALTHRPDLLQVQMNRDISKINYDLTARIYPSNVYEHRLVKAEFEIADLEWEKQKKQARIQVQKAVDGYQLTTKALEITKEDLKLAEVMYNIAQTKYEQGIISQLELLNEETTYYNAKVSYLNSRYTAWLSIFQLEKTVGTSLSPQTSAEQK